MSEHEISEYYEQHGQLVSRYLLRLCGDAALAEELTQETFYQAIRTVGRLRGECKPSVWLCQIARHCWYKHLDKARRSGITVEPDENIPLDEPLPDDKAVAADEKLRVYEAMRKLRGEAREVMYLRILGELSFAEIAHVMDKTETWARVTYFRAKKRLQEELSNEA